MSLKAVTAVAVAVTLGAGTALAADAAPPPPATSFFVKTAKKKQVKAKYKKSKKRLKLAKKRYKKAKRSWAKVKKKKTLKQTTRNLRETARLGFQTNGDNKRSTWLKRNPEVKSGTLRYYAMRQVQKYWKKDWKSQWKCLDRMWWHESEWKNISGGGVSQTPKEWYMPNNVTKYSTSNPRHYVDTGIWYIRKATLGKGPKYGTPCKAWNHWKNEGRNGKYGWGWY